MSYLELRNPVLAIVGHLCGAKEGALKPKNRVSFPGLIQVKLQELGELIDLKAAGQLERSYAAEKGYRIIEELAEDERGASGAEIDLPQLDRVRGSGRYPAPLFH